MAITKGYRPPWLDERIKASKVPSRSATREKARQAARRQNRASGYVPPPPKPKAYVPPHILGGGVRGNMVVPVTPTRSVGLGLPPISVMNAVPSSVAGLSSGITERIRKQARMKSAAQRQQARQAARSANLTGVEPSEGTIPSGWGGRSDLYRKNPYSDNVPRLFDYSQQQAKFGNFEDYQKAVEARKHGYVPNRYDDIADYLDTDPEEGQGGGSGSGYGYPYYPGGPSYKTKEQYQPGHRPDWGLWNTFVQETTWNV